MRRAQAKAPPEAAPITRTTSDADFNLLSSMAFKTPLVSDWTEVDTACADANRAAAVSMHSTSESGSGEITFQLEPASTAEGTATPRLSRRALRSSRPRDSRPLTVP